MNDPPGGVHAGWASQIAIIHTWTPKVSKLMALMAIIMGLGLLFYILLGFRYYREDGKYAVYIDVSIYIHRARPSLGFRVVQACLFFSR